MNENILILNDLNTGNNIKQGDRTILKYLCDDGNGDKLDLTGLPARAVLKTRKNQVVYQTEAQISDRNEVTFIIDRVVPANQYVLEIVVDNQYVFPSDNSIYLNVTKSSIGSVDDFIQNNSREYLEEIIDQRIGDNFVTVEYVDGKIVDLATKDEIKDFLTAEDIADLKSIDISHLASIEYVDGKIANIDLSEYATSEEVEKIVGALASTEYVDGKVDNIDLTGLATKEEIENFITDESLTGLATKEEIKDHLTVEELKNIYLQDYATNEYVDSRVTGLASTEYVDGKVNDIDLTPYATKEELDNIDLTGLATESYVDSAVTGLATTGYVDDKVSGIDLSGFATKDILVNYVDVNDLSGYAIKDDLTGLASEEYVDDKVNSVDLTPFATKDDLTPLATTEYVDSLNISDQLTNYATKKDLENIELTEAQKAELKGDPFRYEDFTEEQLQALKGKDGKSFTYEDFTPEQLEALKGKDGKAFTYSDFTKAQLQALKGAKGEPGQSVKVWKGTGEEYIALETKDPNTIYLIKEG